MLLVELINNNINYTEIVASDKLYINIFLII